MDNMLPEKVDVLQDFFGPSIYELAHKLKVIKRVRKFDAMSLLLTVVFSFMENGGASYNDMACFSHNLGVSIKRQSVFARFNEPFVAFLKQIFENSLVKLGKTWTIPLAIFKHFKAVYLLDSTNIALKKELLNEYVRSGTKNQAGIKLQTYWDCLKGNLNELDLQQGKDSDQAYPYFEKVKKDELILVDLGYVSKQKILTIIALKAYILCRLDLSAKVYDKEGNELDLEKELASEANICEKRVYLTPKNTNTNEGLRLVANRLPKDAVEKRLKTLTAKAKDKGRAVPRDALKFIEWQIYLTNVPQVWWPSEVVGLIYRLRWQIELLFKLWKSGANLDHQPGRTSNRVKAETYAKLIGLVLFCYLTEPVYLTSEGVTLEEVELNQLLELSAPKALKVLRSHVLNLAKILLSRDKDALLKLLTLLKDLWLNYGVKERQRSRNSTFDLLYKSGVST